MATYQEQHTQFVSNLTGTTFSEVMLVSLQLPLSVLLVPTLLPLLWPELLRPGRRLLPASAARLTGEAAGGAEGVATSTSVFWHCQKIGWR